MYFDAIQSKLPDIRDERGKRHELAFIVVCFLVAILRSDKALNMSVIHRSMLEDFGRLSRTLRLDAGHCISYSQLKRVIKSIDHESLNSINDGYFGKHVCQEGTKWKTIDGKELRGSIDGVKGKKRGQNIVNMVSHQDLQSSIIGGYDGSKASEKVVVTDYLKALAVNDCSNFTFDALHTSDLNLRLISQKGGYFLAQIKKNQRILLEDCQDIVFYGQAVCEKKEVQKGHGRVDERKYKAYEIDLEDLQPRWKNTNSCTLIVVERKRYIVKTGKQSTETAYWISNQSIDNEKFAGLPEAIRKHWSVEVHHYCRDVQWGEDKMIMRDKDEAKVVASFITVTTNLFQKQGSNTSELREKITKNWKMVNALFKPK